MIRKLSLRYDQLSDELERIEDTRTNDKGSDYYNTWENVDELMLNEWIVKAKSLIANTCGENSEHIKAFYSAEDPGPISSGNFGKFKRIKAVFRAAKEDFQGGFLFSVRSLVQAELFESELEQASELLLNGYKGPAAVVAGVVLETNLRDLADQNSIPIAKLDKMNADLAKAGVYNKLQQKRITALADIRNSAAHGDWDLFDDIDVKRMISEVESFVSKSLS